MVGDLNVLLLFEDLRSIMNYVLVQKSLSKHLWIRIEHIRYPMNCNVLSTEQDRFLVFNYGLASKEKMRATLKLLN